MELPFTLHKAGALSKIVRTEDDYNAAVADGWTIEDPDQHPVPPPKDPPPPKDQAFAKDDLPPAPPAKDADSGGSKSKK